MNISFNYHSSVARKARFARHFTPGLKFLLAIIGIVILLIGLVLYLVDFTSPAILVGSTAIWYFLPLIWYNDHLRHLKPHHTPGQEIKVEIAFDPEVVGRLHSINTPADIWQAIGPTWQAKFFSTRYNIAPDILNHYMRETPEIMPQFWQEIVVLQQKYNLDYISTGCLMVGLIRLIPDNMGLLGKVHLDLDDIETVINWLEYAQDLRLPKRVGLSQYGGIARDWTSGFTPTLNTLAHNISLSIEAGAYGRRSHGLHQQTIDEMINLIGKSGRPNVALVGKLGVGKTRAVIGFARRILSGQNVDGSIKFAQVFAIDATTLINQTEGGGKLELVITKMVNEAHKAKNAILFFDDAHVFFEEGTGSIDVTKVLMPVIQSGSVPIIMAMTERDWQNLSAKNQAFTGLMNYLKVPEPDNQQIMRVLEDNSLRIGGQHRVIIEYQALREAINLSERYLHDMAAPGRVIRLLEGAVNHANGNVVDEKSVQASIEATLGVKVATADAQESQQLLNLEDEIHKRMINQNRAVSVVADALRRARSGINNPNRPIGTFLFMGPTGVGKTELTKAIAASYFGDEANIVRADMNEYTQSGDTARLIDPKTGDGIISHIRRQPFSVVLFDEIEKAHPDVVNLLLQVLDEGILRDTNNQEASFKDAILIATSNAGANTIRNAIEAGQELHQFEKQFIDMLINSNLFKPEFMNRFDEIVLFRPLKPEELIQVVDLLLMSINKTLANKKVAVALTPDAKEWIVASGYDARLGARPIRRMMQRSVENIVAKKLLSGNFPPGSTITLSSQDLASSQSS